MVRDAAKAAAAARLGQMKGTEPLATEPRVSAGALPARLRSGPLCSLHLPPAGPGVTAALPLLHPGLSPQPLGTFETPQQPISAERSPPSQQPVP